MQHSINICDNAQVLKQSLATLKLLKWAFCEKGCFLSDEGVCLLCRYGLLDNWQLCRWCFLSTSHASHYQLRPHLSTVGILDTSCNVLVLKQPPFSRKRQRIRKIPMGTLFVESLKRLETDMGANTRNPLSLLQLTMRFLFFFYFSIIDTCS